MRLLAKRIFSVQTMHFRHRRVIGNLCGASVYRSHPWVVCAWLSGAPVPWRGRLSAK